MKLKHLTSTILFILISSLSQTSLADTTVSQRVDSSDAMGKMILQSISLMGIPYKWGGNTPETGMDCSGFIRYVFKKSLGIELPRTVAQMAKVGRRIALKDIEPGDLVFLNHNHHIGMYIGHNKIIESPHTGESIKITPFSSYWRKNLVGIKRIVQEDEDNEGNTTLEEYQGIRDEPLPDYTYHPSSRHHSRRETKVTTRHRRIVKSSHHNSQHSRTTLKKKKVVSKTKHARVIKKIKAHVEHKAKHSTTHHHAR